MRAILNVRCVPRSSSDAALKIIRGLADVDLVGLDLVEVAPAYDNGDITSLAGATIALEMLYAMAAKMRKR